MEEKVIETKLCRQCSTSFDITDKDSEFYDKISPISGGAKYPIPSPTLCPDCRQRNRLSWRNERKLYHRKCDFTGKEILSIYSPDKKYKVYDHHIWRGDQWDAQEYGQEIDFFRSFFDQLNELFQKVPLLSINVIGNENCDYVNYCGYSKDCYLSYNADYSEKLFYCSNCIRCKDSVDLYKCSDSSLCFDSVDLYNCYNTQYSDFSFDCNNSSYISSCKNCSNCFGCINLVNKQYCIFNEQYTKEEYEKNIQDLQQKSKREVEKLVQKFFLTKPYLFMKGNTYELSSGNYIFNSKNASNCFDIENCENIKNCGVVNAVNNCQDRDHTGYGGDLCYQLSSCGDKIQKCMADFNIRSVANNVYYCILGSNLTDCFFCVGLRNKQYCIFNKQYSRNEYEILVAKIVTKMMQNGEWGEYFPNMLNAFGYNESIAMESLPLSKEAALKQGFKRSDYETPFPQVEKTLKVNEIPDIKNVTDEILQQAIICEVSGKPFRIIRQELDFYRKNNLPLPTKHPDIRHAERMALRNPRKLRDRTCMKCGIAIQTSYAPDRTEKVYCEACYTKEIYG